MVFVMETGSSSAASVSKDIYKSDDLKELNVKLSQYTCRTSKPPSLDEVGNYLTVSLHVWDDQIITSDIVDKTDNLILQHDADCKDLNEDDLSSVTITGSSKYSTFPCSGMQLSPAISSDGEGEEGLDDIVVAMKHTGCETNKIASPRSISLPLVSAMKGTRQKLGKTREKLSVTWAPDVYDPPPSSSSTYTIYNKPRRKGERKKNVEGKKNGKKKQKRKPSKWGGSSKDKKPVLKYTRGTDYFYQSLDDEDRLVVKSFNVGQPKTDSHCGSTLLKDSIANLHFSVAEAT